MANRIVRRSGRSFRGGSKRQTAWLFMGGSITVITGGSGAVLISTLNAAALALRPFTVVRVRGYLQLVSDQAAAAEDQAINFGLAVVSNQAIAIGVTAIPTPTTDQGSELFFVYQSLMAAGDLVSAGQQGNHLEYDSRAMRKVAEGEDIAVVVETEVAGLTQGVALRHTGRILVKLH